MTRVLVTGSTGMVGTALVADLRRDGLEVVRLVRDSTGGGAGSASWNPSANQLDQAAVEGFDAVVHLAAENIGDGRWTEAKKKRIMESRRRGTRLLAERLAAAAQKPSVLVCASAVGYYGDRGEEILTEEAPRGTGFLADVVQEWEEATNAAANAGIRVVNVRNGVVLSTKGGALAKMLPPFKMGLGGPLGDGSQWVSWLTLDDAVRAIRHVIDTPSIAGPINVTAPPVRGKEFANALGKALHRPAAIPVPLFAVRLVLGEGADEMTASQRVSSQKLMSTGFQFEYPDIEEAMRHVIKHR